MRPRGQSFTRRTAQQREHRDPQSCRVAIPLAWRRVRVRVLQLSGCPPTLESRPRSVSRARGSTRGPKMVGHTPLYFAGACPIGVGPQSPAVIFDCPCEHTEHRIPLSAAAITIVREVAQLRTSQYLFAGRNGKRPLCGWPLRNLLPHPMTVHGTRSAFSDWAIERTSPMKPSKPHWPTKQERPSRGLTTEPMLWSDGVNSWKHGLIFSSRKRDLIFGKVSLVSFRKIVRIHICWDDN